MVDPLSRIILTSIQREFLQCALIVCFSFRRAILTDSPEPLLIENTGLFQLSLYESPACMELTANIDPMYVQC